MSINQFLLILQSRFHIIFFTLLVTVVSGTLISLKIPKSYLSVASLVINIKSSDPITGTVINPQLLTGYLATQVDIIKSRTVALKVVDQLHLESLPSFKQQFEAATKGEGDIRSWLADLLLDKYVEVTPSRESSVITISCTGETAQFSADLANAFVSGYIQTNLDLSVQPALQQSIWYDEQIKELRDNVERLQNKLSEFQQQTGYISTDKNLDLENNRLAEISSALVTAQTQAFDTSTRERQIHIARANGKLGDLPEIFNNDHIQSLKSELAKADGKLADLSIRLSTNHPEYRTALAEVQNLKQKIANEIGSAQSSLINSANQAQQMEEELKQAMAEQKAKVIALKQQRDTNDLLTQDLASARNALDSTTLRANQIRLESKRSLTDISVLNAAVPPLRHNKPRVMANIFISFFLGGLLGIGLGFMSAMINRQIHCAEDIINDLTLPLLITIPSAPKSSLSHTALQWLKRIGAKEQVA
jgi:chain length determinant protein EpsF